MNKNVRAVIGAAMTAALGLTLALPAMSLSAAPAAAVTRDDIEKKQQQNANERKKVEAALEDTSAQLKDTYLRLSDARDDLKVAKMELALAQSDYIKAKRESDDFKARLQVAIDERTRIEADIKANEAALATAQDSLAEIARDSAADASMADSTLGLLLNSESVDDLISAYQAADVAAQVQQDAIFSLQQQSGAMANQRARLAAVEKEIANLKAKADQKAADAKAAQERAAKKQTEISSLVTKETELAKKLNKEKTGYLAKEKQLDADKKKLDDKLAEIARKEAAAFKKGKAVRKTTGSFGWPVSNPVVTSPFGMRVHPITGVYKLHSGTDFGSSCGTPILAAATGEVLWASYQGAWGNQTAINHGIMSGQPTVTTYNHQSRMLVHAGQVVQRGQVIGYVGTTGYSTGCHLHFEIHKNGVPVNPMNYY